MFCACKFFIRQSRTLLVLVASAGWAGELRQWTCPPEKPFAAELLAADGMRATLLVPGRGKAVVPFARLSPEDVRYIREWRMQNRRAPLIDPEKIGRASCRERVFSSV